MADDAKPFLDAIGRFSRSDIDGAIVFTRNALRTFINQENIKHNIRLDKPERYLGIAWNELSEPHKKGSLKGSEKLFHFNSIRGLYALLLAGAQFAVMRHETDIFKTLRTRSGKSPTLSLGHDPNVSGLWDDDQCQSPDADSSCATEASAGLKVLQAALVSKSSKAHLTAIEIVRLICEQLEEAATTKTQTRYRQGLKIPPKFKLDNGHIAEILHISAGEVAAAKRIMLSELQKLGYTSFAQLISKMGKQDPSPPARPISLKPRQAGNLQKSTDPQMCLDSAGEDIHDRT